MKREQYTKDQWGKVLADRWDQLDDLHQKGVIDEHPGKAGWNKDSATLRKAARDDAGNSEALDDYEATTTGVKGGPKNGASISAADSNALARVQRMLKRLP